MAKGTILKNLQSLFNIQVKTVAGQKDKTIIPAKKTDDGRVTPVKFPSDLQKIWQWWLKENHDSSETLKDRINRYNDLDYMVYNDTVISMAAELYADEATQVDSQSVVMHVQAKDRKVEKEIIHLLQKWGITQPMIRAKAYDLALYGDSFNINATSNEKGIIEATAVDVKDVSDRIEFKASEAARQMDKQKYQTLASKDARLKVLADILSKEGSDYASYFKSYLFGFQIGEKNFLPPWNVSHFRLFTTKSEFWPYGRSLFINAISPFRQLKASKNMMALARAAKFPKELFEIEVSDSMDPLEQWEIVNEARQEYQNLGFNTLDTEEFAVGGQIWAPKGKLDYTLIENNMRLEDIADIELLRDDMIIATRIPKGYLIVDRASFGTSGQALLQQFKPFGRAVYFVQSAILTEIATMLKVHFTMTGEFDSDKTDFELSMNFPVVEESSDRLRMKNDTLRLAGDIVSAIQNALGTRDGLPPEVIKAIFGKLSFLEPEDVDAWVDTSAEALLDENFRPLINRNLAESDKTKIKSRLSDQAIFGGYFEALKKNNVTEGVFNQRHILTSASEDKSYRSVFDALRVTSAASHKILD